MLALHEYRAGNLVQLSEAECAAAVAAERLHDVVGNKRILMSAEQEASTRARWAAADADSALRALNQARCEVIDAAIAGDTTVQQLKAMTNEEFDAWWASNVTNAAQAIALLKRLARVVIRRVV